MNLVIITDLEGDRVAFPIEHIVSIEECVSTSTSNIFIAMREFPITVKGLMEDVLLCITSQLYNENEVVFEPDYNSSQAGE